MTNPAPELQADLDNARAAQRQLEIDLAEAAHQLEAARAELEALQEDHGDALGELEAARAELATARAELADTSAQLERVIAIARRVARWDGKRQRMRMLTAGR